MTKVHNCEREREPTREEIREWLTRPFEPARACPVEPPDEYPALERTSDEGIQEVERE